MTSQQRSVCYFNIMQTLATGRLDADTEHAVITYLSADGLHEAFSLLKKADVQTLVAVQKIIGPRRGNGSPVDSLDGWRLNAGVWQECR